MIRSAMIAVGIVCAGAACVASGASRPELQGWSSHTFGLDMVRSEIGGDSIWIGTRGGVLRFRADAEQFSKFTRLDGCLPSNVVTGLAIDETRGDVWVATQRGIARTPIDTPQGEEWEVFDGSNSPFERDVTDIAVGHDGTVYIGTFEDSVWTYDGAVFTQLPVIEAPGDNALASRSIISVFVDSDGLLWVGMDGGVIDMYDGETFTHVTEAETFPGGDFPNIPCEQVPLLPPDDLGLLGPVIRVLGENPAEGTIWFQNLAESPQCGTFGGITSFDGANWTTYTTANSGVPNDLADGIGVGPAGETILLTPAGNAALIGGEWVRSARRRRAIP